MNIEVPKYDKDVRCVAGIGAIDLIYGKILFTTTEKSFKGADIVQFLKKLRKKMKSLDRDKLYTIVWDNCSAHTSRAVKEYMSDKDIYCIFTPPYQP